MGYLNSYYGASLRNKVICSSEKTDCNSGENMDQVVRYNAGARLQMSFCLLLRAATCILLIIVMINFPDGFSGQYFRIF